MSEGNKMEQVHPQLPETVKSLGFVKQARAILMDPGASKYRVEWANRIIAEHEDDVTAGRSIR